MFLDRIVEITDKEHFESSLRLLCLTLMGQCSILVHSRDLSFGFDVLSLWIKRLKSEPADQAVEIIVKIKSLIRLWALPRYRAELEPLLRNLLKESESVYLLDFVSQLLNTRVSILGFHLNLLSILTCVDHGRLFCAKVRPSLN